MGRHNKIVDGGSLDGLILPEGNITVVAITKDNEYLIYNGYLYKKIGGETPDKGED